MTLPAIPHLARAVFDNPLIGKEIRVASRQSSHLVAIIFFLVAGLAIAFVPMAIEQSGNPTAALPINRLPILGRRQKGEHDSENSSCF